MYSKITDGDIKESLDELSEVFGFDLIAKSRYDKHTRPRWAVFFMLRSSGATYKAISRVSGYNRWNVKHGIERFKMEVMSNNEFAVECYNKVLDHVNSRRKKKS